MTATNDLREQMIEALAARLHVTTDRITGLTHGIALSADTASVREAVDALLPLLRREQRMAYTLGQLAGLDDFERNDGSLTPNPYSG